MREILFRGKRADNGEWVYGAYYKQEHYYGYEKIAHCIITTKEVLSDDIALDYDEVITETIGQYTGLTDKNGKKIFEGDIIKVHVETLTKMWDIIGVVENYNASYGFYYENRQHFIAFNKTSWNVRWYEVIGNIYDNPELLEVEECID